MEDREIIGKFDGQHMMGEDNKRYPIPANYASKSKLIEGDNLKLTISEDGTFVFKQIEPVPRKRIMGTVTDDGQVNTEYGDYRILHSSLTYFKAEMGDEAIIIIPQKSGAEWAALENIIKNYD
jgi:hypothetical protein